MRFSSPSTITNAFDNFNYDDFKWPVGSEERIKSIIHRDLAKSEVVFVSAAYLVGHPATERLLFSDDDPTLLKSANEGRIRPLFVDKKKPFVEHAEILLKNNSSAIWNQTKQEVLARARLLDSEIDPQFGSAVPMNALDQIKTWMSRAAVFSICRPCNLRQRYTLAICNSFNRELDCRGRVDATWLLSIPKCFRGLSNLASKFTEAGRQIFGYSHARATGIPLIRGNQLVWPNSGIWNPIEESARLTLKHLNARPRSEHGDSLLLQIAKEFDLRLFHPYPLLNPEDESHSTAAEEQATAPSYWVECSRHLLSSRNGWVSSAEVSMMLEALRRRSSYLIVDERWSTFHIRFRLENRDEIAKPIGSLTKQDRRVLGVLLKSLKHGVPIYHTDLALCKRNVEDVTYETSSNGVSAPHWMISRLNRKLDRFFIAYLNALEGEASYYWASLPEYCWIRPSNAKSLLYRQ